MRIVVIILYSLIYIPIYSQEHIVFSSINANNGLSDNSVRSICQLHDGRMVIVTLGMINIYDGSNFLHLHYSDENAYPLSKFYGWHITYIDGNDNVWLKNQHKLYLFDVKKESYIPDVDSIFRSWGLNDPLTDLFIDTNENFWFITDKNELLLRKGSHERANPFINNVLIFQQSK